ncbi:MAG: hypothetical protein WCI51_18400 [Lentisphaerota bacterium]
MHYIIALFVIIGLIGAAMLLTDEDHNWFGSGEVVNIVKKFKQEEDAFAQFCKEQEGRDNARKDDPVQVTKAETRNDTPSPVQQPAASVRSPAPSGGAAFSSNPFGSTASAVTSNPKPFGNVDFNSFGDTPQPAPAAQAPAGPVAQTPASGGSQSQAQQMQSSSNPIIKTWAGYVSQIEAAEK